MLIDVPQRKESMIKSALKQNKKNLCHNKTTLVGHKHQEQGKGPPGVPSPILIVTQNFWKPFYPRPFCGGLTINTGG